MINNMALLYTAIVILCLSGSNLAQVTKGGQCPNITEAQSDVDVNQLSNGTWYEVKRYPALFEISGKCNTITFRAGANNSVDLLDDYDSTSSGRNVAVFISLYPSKNDPSVFCTHIPNTPPEVESKCWFLAVDYNGCISTYCCTDGQDTSSRYAWIVCRDPKPSKSEVDTACKAFDDNNIDTNFLQVAKQKNCPENLTTQ